MKIKGFTLAELLITMSIIGVIASLTLPALNTNMLKQQAGSGLMKGINEIQQATMLLLRENDARSLTNIGYSTATQNIEPVSNANTTACTQSTFLNCITYLEGTNRTSGIRFSTARIPAYKNFDLTNFPINTRMRPTPYISSDGISYIYFGDDAIHQVSLYILDVNGNKFPNVIGKDAFLIAINRRGTVVPVGGREFAVMTGNNPTNPLWMTTCNNGSRPTNARNCAGAIADNNGQVKYKFN